MTKPWKFLTINAVMIPVVSLAGWMLACPVGAQQPERYTLQPMMRMDGSIFVDAQITPPPPPIPQNKTTDTNVPPFIQPAPQPEPVVARRVILGIMLPDTTLVCREEVRTMTCKTIDELFAKKGK